MIGQPIITVNFFSGFEKTRWVDRNVMTAACYSSKLQSGQGWAQCTLLVLIDFCPVESEFLTCSFASKTFDILSENSMEYQI